MSLQFFAQTQIQRALETRVTGDLASMEHGKRLALPTGEVCDHQRERKKESMKHITRWVVLGFVAILLGIFSTTIATKHITLAKTKSYTAEVVATASLSSQSVSPVTANLVVPNHNSSSWLAGSTLLSLVSTSSESTLLILSGISFVAIALFLRSRSHMASTANRP